MNDPYANMFLYSGEWYLLEVKVDKWVIPLYGSLPSFVAMCYQGKNNLGQRVWSTVENPRPEQIMIDDWNSDDKIRLVSHLQRSPIAPAP